MATNYEYITKYDSQNYTPAGSVKKVYGMDRKITGITIHHWGNLNQKFQNIVNFLCRKGGNTSAHEVIEDGRVAVIVDHKNAAWHAGNRVGNATTIGLECRPEATAGDYETVAERIADLREAYGNLPLYPHRHWKATACPGKWDLKKLDRMADEILEGRKGGAKPKPAPTKPAPTKPTASKPAGKSVAQMASEVIAGKHGNGHAARQKSLGVDASTYAKVRAEVNRRAGGGAPAKPKGKSVAQMATEVIQGKHGNGHANRQRSLGVSAATYAKVRAEVNRRS